MSERMVVVSTELNPSVYIKYGNISARNFWTFRWVIIPLAIVMSFFSILMFTSVPEYPERIGMAIVFLAIGLVPLSLFYLPGKFFGTHTIQMKPHKIILTFYQDRLNIDVTGGRDGEWCLKDRGSSEIWFDPDIEYYGNKDWSYDEINANRTKDYFYLSRGRFISGIVFERSQITYGGPDQLKELLEKQCKRYTVGKDALRD